MKMSIFNIEKRKNHAFFNQTNNKKILSNGITALSFISSKREEEKIRYAASQNTRGKKAIRRSRNRRRLLIALIALGIIGTITFSILNVISLKKEQHSIKEQQEALEKEKAQLEKDGKVPFFRQENLTLFIGNEQIAGRNLSQ